MYSILLVSSCVPILLYNVLALNNIIILQRHYIIIAITCIIYIIYAHVSMLLFLTCYYHCRFLCIRNQDKVKSPYSAINQLVDMGSRPAPTPQLLALCSGSFHPTNRQDKKLSTLDSTGLSVDENTTDLLGLCSGAFPTATGPAQSLPRHINFSSSDEEEGMPQITRKKIFKRKKINNRFAIDYTHTCVCIHYFE